MGKNKRILVVLLLACIAGGAFLLLKPKNDLQLLPDPAFKPDKEIRMIATNYAFAPNSIVVKKGEKVRLKLFSKEGTHGISVPELNLIQYMPEGEEVTADFTADIVGEFRFICSIYCGSGHGEMTGTIVVTE